MQKKVNNSKKMTVLYILNCAVLYGANRSILDLVDGLRKNHSNFQFCFIIPEKGPVEVELRKRKYLYWIIPFKPDTYEKSNGITWNDIQNQAINYVLAMKFLPVLKRASVDIIHTNSSNVDFGAVLSILTGKKHIWHFREFLQEHYNLYWVFPKLQKWYMRKADCVIYISNAIKKKYYSSQIRGQVVYNGVVKIDNTKKLTDTGQNIGREYRIICAGVIMTGKRQLDSACAVNYVLKETDYKVHLKIIGSGDSVYINQIKKYIVSNHLSENIEILPYQKNLSEIRRQSDIGLVTSRYEGLGRVTIESMNDGLLTIGANSGATSEIIQDGVTGYLYRVGSSRELAEKIKLAINDIQKGNDILIKQNAKQFVIENFECEKQAEEIYTIYQRAMR